MDVQIINGDIENLSAGGYRYISGVDEAVQRVRIAALTAKGGFIYDRGLGTDYGSFGTDEPMPTEKLNLLIKEACCDIADADVNVVSFDTDTLKALIRVSYRGDTVNTEVDLSGILR